MLNDEGIRMIKDEEILGFFLFIAFASSFINMDL